MGRSTIDRAILQIRIDIPNDMAVFGGVGAKMTIEPAGEHDARDHCNGSRLGRAAAWNVVAARVRRSPHLVPGLEIQRMQTATYFVVQQQRDRWVQR